MPRLNSQRRGADCKILILLTIGFDSTEDGRPKGQEIGASKRFRRWYSVVRPAGKESHLASLAMSRTVSPDEAKAEAKALPCASGSNTLIADESYVQITILQII